MNDSGGAIGLRSWGIFAAGALLSVVGLVGVYGGSTLSTQSLTPQAGEAAEDGEDEGGPAATYQAAPVRLEPGRYNLTLSMRFRRSTTRTLGYPVQVTCEALPGWRYASEFRVSREKKASSRRKRVDVTTSFLVTKAGEYALSLALPAGPSRGLEVRVRRAYFDGRLPLGLGVVLMALAAFLSPGIRSTLGEMLQQRR